MSTEPPFHHLLQRRRDTSGIALVVTLSLMVLATVAIVAFFARATTNQQITSGSAQSVVATTFTDGATTEIIAGLQKEMWDVSGYSQSTPTSPAIFPITTAQGCVPSRMVSPNIPVTPVLLATSTAPSPTPAPQVDPNSSYAQFANLIKQSYTGIATYSGNSGITATGTIGPPVTGPKIASNISTDMPAIGGRAHDGVYWNQAKLISSSDAKTLSALVPDWVYQARSGSHPTAYSSGAGMESGGNGALGPNSIIGRYAYNIYDTGGLLNANVSGYGSLTGSALGDAQKAPSYSSKNTMIVPALKGSPMMADLSGLALGGNLTINGANAASITNNWQSKLPLFRYRQAWTTDFAKLFASGQYGGWLQPFLSPYDPASVTNASPSVNATSLNNYAFTSRQDLIAWINSQWSSGTGSNGDVSWALPYLTHFSYDTDAPSFTPNTNRPRSNEALGAVGGNGSSRATDDLINKPFTSVLDPNGYPLVKHRFPLSALSLLDNIYPGNVPSDLLNSTSTLYKQIQYDFGLIWDSTHNCWNYQDMEGGSGSIKQLGVIAGLSKQRSPNFFELLKAAITAGSLGKQWGGGSYDLDADNILDAPRYGGNGGINYQIIQIGANIISQTTSNYCPTAIALNGGGQAPVVYGVKDLPYFYRARLLMATVGYFSGKDMQDMEYNPPTNSLLAAALVQPELWNPHAPNMLAPTTNYPVAFRIVPRTGNTYPHNALALQCYFGQNNGQNWATGGTKPYPSGAQSGGIMMGDYLQMGGVLCTPNLSYDNTTPDAYLTFGRDSSHSDILPSATLPSPLGSFREPCPLAAPDFPPNINLTGFPVGKTLTPTSGARFDGKPITQITTNGNTIPPRFAPASNKTALGFLVSYFCSGTGSKTLNTMRYISGGPMIMDLQYSMDGTNFYTYDTLQSSFAGGQTAIAPPSGVQQSQVGVRADPRTNRWGLLWANIPGGQGIYGTGTYSTGQYDLQAGRTFDFTGDLSLNNYGTGGNRNIPQAKGWMNALNTSVMQLGWTQVNQPTGAGYYYDPDNVVRRADAAYVNFDPKTYIVATPPTGLPQAMLQADHNGQGPVLSDYNSRPIVLNRPFQSVAELGYVFRDTPWKSLDFFTPESGDAALLDIFSVYGPDPYSYSDSAKQLSDSAKLLADTALVAGKVNLNTRQPPVLAALLKGASTTTVFPSSTTTTLTPLSDQQATALSQALVQWTTNTTDKTQGPLTNLAELAGKYTGSGSTGYSGISSTLAGILTGQELPVIKQQRECFVHALADSCTTRTWNLLIDLVAQTGNLKQSPGTLQNFVVTGERHVWVSVALDRVTGKVLKMQVEPVRL